MAPLPLTLHLHPATARYAARLTWETYANGDYQTATIDKEIELEVQAHGAHLALTFTTAPPVLTKPDDLEPLEEMAVRLAALYGRVVVQATPTGELTGLLNYEQIQQTREQLAQDLRAATLPDEPVTSAILDFLAEQLQTPARFLQSLGHDYLYQTLAPNFYEQPLGSLGSVTRLRQFAGFFDKTPLWFAEQVQVLPGEHPDQVRLHLHGPLDAQQTDLAAVRSLMTKALQLAGTLPAAELPAPHFRYQATYTLELATGLPLHATLQVYARAGEWYNKEYTLTLHRL